MENVDTGSSPVIFSAFGAASGNASVSLSGRTTPSSASGCAMPPTGVVFAALPAYPSASDKACDCIACGAICLCFATPDSGRATCGDGIGTGRGASASGAGSAGATSSTISSAASCAGASRRTASAMSPSASVTTGCAPRSAGASCQSGTTTTIPSATSAVVAVSAPRVFIRINISVTPLMSPFPGRSKV